jgi:hypothetical protein
VSERIAQSRSAVEEMIAGVAQSVDSNARLRGQVTQLGQVSRRIDKIVEAITTVGIKTNMLAVNGSVEAARAGEFGQGFAVVSNDIRNLAEDPRKTPTASRTWSAPSRSRSPTWPETSTTSAAPRWMKWRRTRSSPPISRA